MPSQILHEMFGGDLIDALSSGLGPGAASAWPALSRGDRGAFAAGCQGPDVFYHGRHTRPLALEYGGLLHRRGCGGFCAGLLAMALPKPGEKPDALAAYALGFLSHAALDRACHPYIVYRSAAVQGRASDNGLYHPFFERILDVLMLGELRGMEAEGWDQKPLAGACADPPPGLKGLVARAIATAYPEKAAKDGLLAARIDGAFADSARFYRLTDPAKTRTESLDAPPQLERRWLSVVYPIGLPDGVDFLNKSRRPWSYPYRPPDRESPALDARSFPEVYADALKSAAEALLPSFAEYLETGAFPVEKAAAGIGDGCLSISDAEGRPCAPNLSDSFPLDAELERQCRLRRAMRG